MPTRFHVQKLRLAQKFGLLCWWCKRELHIDGDHNSASYATRDHIIKRQYSPGEKHIKDNIRLACRKCNNERHAPNWEAPDNSQLTLVNEKV